MNVTRSWSLKSGELNTNIDLNKFKFALVNILNLTKAMAITNRVLFSILFLIPGYIHVSCTDRFSQGTYVTKVEVDQVIDDWLELWTSYDLNMVSEVFWKKDEVSYFSSEKQGLIKGFEALKEHHQGFGFIAGGKHVQSRLWLEEINLTLSSSTAVVSAIWYFQHE